MTRVGDEASLMLERRPEPGQHVVQRQRKTRDLVTCPGDGARRRAPPE